MTIGKQTNFGFDFLNNSQSEKKSQITAQETIRIVSVHKITSVY